ncbi:MAG: DNA polymerase Y family protein, partial [Longispora sp.]|nr:DNA polymerase Y family protein [Longispora sp. (in: high G+C Gram-positive bacteria)]
MRALAVWCQDWPVIAAGSAHDVDVHTPVIVVDKNRVLACSQTARAVGIRRGQRTREAQALSPGLTVVKHNPSRDAIAFESVVANIEKLAAGVEIIRPGLCALAARGPVGWFGGEEAAGEAIVEQVAVTCAVEAQIGIADGVWAAGVAARVGQLIAPGATSEFLAGLDLTVLDRPELTDVLRRLG